jgi:hypothetical protein
MSTPRRGARAPWHLPFALLLAACGGPEEAVRTCSTDAECGPGARCLQSACVANRPPVAALQVPASPTSNRILFIEATATDPDPGDAVARFTWSVAPLGAGCEAEPEPTTGPRLEVVFWCAGTYEVSVQAEDGRGGAGAPARQVVEVAAASGAPEVTPAPESSVDHACSGTPLACRPAVAGSPVALPLSATVVDPAGGALVYRWRVIPPAGADPSARVTYARGEASLSTEAWVEAPSGSIAGTWRFRLRVASAAGLVGRADQVVRIGNRPPVLAGQPALLEHRYEGGAWLAGGTVPLAATDPDGDPVTLTASLAESGTQGCLSQLGPVAAGGVTLEIRCADPTRLIGLATRALRVSAADGNGGTAEATWPVEIGNRPPVVRLASNPAGGKIAVDHTVGACPGTAGSCFIAAGTAAFEAVDPDGDPVAGLAVAAALPSWLPSSTGEATTAGGVTSFRFASSVSKPGAFRAADGTSHFSLEATAADAFGASTTLAAPVVIGNRPPVLVRSAARVAVPHRYDRGLQSYQASATLSSFEDPDGDPLRADGSVGDASCSSFSFVGTEGRVECASRYSPASGLPPLASFVGDHPVLLRAYDGWEGPSSATVVNVQDGAPTATAFAGVVESCFCACSKWSGDGSTCLGARWVADAASMPLPVMADDADGDPVQVTFSPAAASGAQKTVLPGSCDDTLRNPTLPLTVLVTIDDGVGRVQTASTVTGVSCAAAGQDCVP